MHKLRQKRLEKRMTYQEVADKVGITKMHYWYIENNKRNLKLELAKKIAKALEEDPNELFF
ncbi:MULTISPECIES: helix-turn-helix transcriptional regulator [Bacillus cereus group]|uniref:Transcriptional regulator n=1 Tax=Bacillus thuringiensis subsp. higo TaxID=132266 RepID=A0A9X6LJS3_BACUH|nr:MULTISPECIES: helix-turn-helix transcriptional regulator [Bacillus cereus group]MED3322898.1 helix-turn-helix transcriptional regulator [Bacillus thuringiensis]OUB29192.1 transcriptional regulator [Bacillus thuringiensis serovar yunnanensis]MBJ8024622.1 helix-turn-helix transcriptional regulator [Bacillus cereus]MBJ8037377.1 helix-turn-helix transcriptional regulator [Bacillus cereus]OUB47665.1 transcriptional regulator [Bacillus thuringiensis serovar higo]